MKLVSDWKDCWRWWSVRFYAALAVVPVVWSSMPDDVKAYIPTEWQPWIVVAMATAGFAGRLVDQGRA